MGAGRRFGPGGPRPEGSRPSVLRAATSRRETECVVPRARGPLGEGGRRTPQGAAAGWREGAAGGTAPSLGVLILKQKPLVFPGLREGAAGERRGRAEGGALLGLPDPSPARRMGSGPLRGARRRRGRGRPDNRSLCL